MKTRLLCLLLVISLIGGVLFVFMQWYFGLSDPSELPIADRIQELGGSYQVDSGHFAHGHITGVYLDDTTTNDEELTLVLSLTKLRVLHLRNTCITNKSINVLVKHQNLAKIDISGTQLSPDLLRIACFENAKDSPKKLIFEIIYDQ